MPARCAIPAITCGACSPSKDPLPGESQKLPAVAVQRFETPAYLRPGRIVYRESPERIGFYDYHRWASDPGEVVTTAMIDSLRAAGVFSTIQTYDGQERAPFILQGTLERLNELDYENGVQVEVRLCAQVLNKKTGAVVWADEATKTANVGQRQVTSVVQAIGQATQAGIEQLVQDMKKQLFAMTVVAGNAVVPPAENEPIIGKGHAWPY